MLILNFRLALVLWGVLVPAISLVADEIQFNRDVRPILSDACFHCHGPDSAHREADLRLDVADGRDIVIRELVDRITSDDPDVVMPPLESGKELTPEQKEILKQWVALAAPYEAYWAYVAPVASPQKTAIAEGWSNDRWDDYIAAKIAQQSLTPSPDADPATLIRRVTLDLTGLLPTADDLDAFVSDPSDLAYRRYVDRLLASPALGERMSVYWLDLVRFADTVGYHGDQDHNITPYRDYVIDAFNSNMPFDQFTIEQLAGDLLPDASQDQLIASGYNRLLQTSHEGGLQPKEYLSIYAADRIRNLSVVWMGATVGCAQCHDHKYDPFTARDFYSLSAFFADLDESQHFKTGTNSLPTKRSPELNVLSKWQRDWLSEIDSALLLNPNNKELQRQKKRLEKSRRLTMVSKSISPREVRVLPRGNWLDVSGDVVSPAVPGFMKQPTSNGQPSRLDLAKWLVDDDKGIGGQTARVFANRFWYLMFGRGISSSLDDFGGQGQPPTHPMLLDQIAIDFVQSGWDIKQLLRRMVLSRTYRQSSFANEKTLRRDPYNLWFARQSRYRLPAEMVRDSSLQLGGLLVRDVGGASVKPYQPAGYYRHLNFPARKYKHDQGASQWRRGVYVHWQRQFLHPAMKALDAPSREECTAQRPRSNTPLEALALLNDRTSIETAVAMAQRLMKSHTPESDSARIQRAFRMATSRQPDKHETAELLSLFHTQQSQYRQNAAMADDLLNSCKNLRLDADLDRPQLAAWTSVARAILNLYETASRN